MPRHSSAKFVPYDLRPAKQCERRMMLESFFTAMESDFAIPDYRYVGMGGNRFYDFVLIHKYLGIAKMISLEHDDSMIARAEFNCPYKFIDVRHATVDDFILSDNFEGNSIYWLDYDGSISAEVTDDVTSVAQNAMPGDFVFVTVCGGTPRFLKEKSTKERLLEFQESLPEFTSMMTQKDMEDANFSATAREILRRAFAYAFAVRMEHFDPFFQVRYKDTVDMVTYGGVFATKRQCGRLRNRLEGRVPFLSAQPGTMYRIRTLNLTEKERNLIDLAASAKRSNAKEISALRKLGFRRSELRTYTELLRYYPRYVETLL